MEVTSAKAFKDDAPIWKDDIFPCRLKVKVVVALDPETGVPVREMKDVLSAFKTAKSDSYSLAWTGRFRGSPARWSQADGEAVVQAVLSAQKNPVKRPIDPEKLRYKPKTAIASKIGLVTVPDSEPQLESEKSTSDSPKESTAHTEVQYLRLQLGSEMGFEVWAAKNDRSKTHSGTKFAEMPKMKDSLPLQFDEVTNRTIELIDVLWLKGNAIAAAFEIESNQFTRDCCEWPIYWRCSRTSTFRSILSPRTNGGTRYWKR